MIVSKDAERVTQLFNGAVDNFKIERLEMGVVKLDDSGHEFFKQSGRKVVLRTFKQRTDLPQDLVVRQDRARTARCGFHEMASNRCIVSERKILSVDGHLVKEVAS